MPIGWVKMSSELAHYHRAWLPLIRYVTNSVDDAGKWKDSAQAFTLNRRMKKVSADTVLDTQVCTISSGDLVTGWALQRKQGTKQQQHNKETKHQSQTAF